MLDACPHHHEDESAAETALDGINLRAPGSSKPGAKKIWRSLDELSGTKSFESMVHREFPHMASEWHEGHSRRNFLKLMSASMALAGLSACTLKKTEEKIVPYVNQPEDVIPGRPLFFASTMPFAGYGKGVVVESHEGRPTKIEGNPDHPASLGSSDIWMQASVLELYDPDRSQHVFHGQNTSTWGKFTEELTPRLADLQAKQGAGLRFLTGTVTSPTIVRQMKAIIAKYPQAKWHVFEPIGRKNAKAGAMDAFGQDVETLFNFDKADVILSLESNFLTEYAGSIPYSRQFTAGRKIRSTNKTGKDLEMNRLYVAEASVTVTGAQADHRLAIKSSDIADLATDILAVLSGKSASGKYTKWAEGVAADLKKNTGRSLVIVGESQPASVHAIGHAINALLKNVGTTLSCIEPVEVAGDSLEDLVKDMNANLVDTLFIIGTNPAFTAPRSYGLNLGLEADATERTNGWTKNPLSKVTLIVNHSLYNGENEETSGLSHWHIPASHYLESWGDIRSFDGTASIIQPLIYPLYTTKSEIELLAFVLGDMTSTAYDLVQATWTGAGKLSSDDWSRALEKGVIPNTASAVKTPVLKAGVVSAAMSNPPTSQPAGKPEMEIVFRPDPSIYDGRFANCGWLQELPKPITLLTWENVALLSFNTAQRLEISQLDDNRGCNVKKVELKLPDGRKLEIPALIMPGHADDSVTVYLGYGRTRVGGIGMEKDGSGQTIWGPLPKGSDAYSLRSGDAWFETGLTVDVQDGDAWIATAQSHHLIDKPDTKPVELDQEWTAERELIRRFDLEELNNGTDEEEKHTAGQGKKFSTLSLPLFKPDPVKDVNGILIPPWDYQFNKWGMVIDNQACIGCNACVIACQSENNIAIVGKEQVLKGREMHWIRIDTYFIGEAEGTPEVFQQPIPCMQCENAPCELVCPVEATSTSAEGINEQTYNRCVGTRYCSNNCPYKVRRFNFLEYTDYTTASIQLQRNPNVTVRARGIMEKCNFCVQRVNNARIEAKKQDRPINPGRDGRLGDVAMACEQACPTQAITFGNLNDPRWEVTKLQNEPLRYTLLDELNALPRVSYLGRVKNPNPEMAGV